MDGNIACYAHQRNGGIVDDIRIFENISQQLSMFAVVVEKPEFSEFQERSRKLVLDVKNLEALTLEVCSTSREVLQLQREERRRNGG